MLIKQSELPIADPTLLEASTICEAVNEIIEGVGAGMPPKSTVVRWSERFKDGNFVCNFVLKTYLVLAGHVFWMKVILKPL
ncbi:hypothetical protein KIN20_034086 [Parelaphostrongylus tenuis]|uniref:Mos1 transposase HTH domain-containing protein n=1 Tax=Parelaphostrongylus tenuis TaxID=148309 RepID=A0AAD5RBQ5_PARTN|nr:hypothetical protein KIN20_034086 [Parelaphostrongylus tenuis]